MVVIRSTKLANTQRGRTSEYQNFKTGGTYYYHCSVKGSNINFYYSMVYLHEFLTTLNTQRRHDRQ